MKKVKEYGPLVASGRHDSMGEQIYYQKVTVRDQNGKLLYEDERQMLADGTTPGAPLRYSSAGIV